MKIFNEKQKWKEEQFLMLYLINKNIKILILLLVVISCNKERHSIKLKKEVKQKILTTSIGDFFSDSIHHQIESKFFSKYTSYKSKDTICNSWKIPTQKITYKMINELESLHPYEWNTYFGTFPCGVTGKLLFKERVFTFHLNAGGWIILRNKDTTIYLGSKNRKYEKYFISQYNNEN